MSTLSVRDPVVVKIQFMIIAIIRILDGYDKPIMSLFSTYVVQEGYCPLFARDIIESLA